MQNLPVVSISTMNADFDGTKYIPTLSLTTRIKRGPEKGKRKVVVRKLFWR